MTIDPKFSELLPLLYQALTTRRGIVVTTNNVDVLKSRLYKARAKVKDHSPELMDLTIQTSRQNPMSEVWIVKSNLKEANADMTHGQD